LERKEFGIGFIHFGGPKCGVWFFLLGRDDWTWNFRWNVKQLVDLGFQARFSVGQVHRDTWILDADTQLGMDGVVNGWGPLWGLAINGLDSSIYLNVGGYNMI
jgi:hypothetical protein